MGLERRTAAAGAARHHRREDHPAALRSVLSQSPRRDPCLARPRPGPGAGGRGRALEQPDQLPGKPQRRLGAVLRRYPEAARPGQLRRHDDPRLYPRRGSRLHHLDGQGRRWPVQQLLLAFSDVPGLHALHPAGHARPAGLPHRERSGRRSLEQRQYGVGARGLQRNRPLEQGRRPADPLVDPVSLAARGR